MKPEEDLIIKVAAKGLERIRGNGSMTAGHNGLYQDKETPVRNTGHWLIIFVSAYEISKNKTFFTAAERCAEYLYSRKARPFGYSFYHRNSKGRDRCNGLVGQAWTIESLNKATRILERERYRRLALEVFGQHEFDHQLGLWHSLDIDGKRLPIDSTLNHQIWFAAVGSELRVRLIDEQINRFLDRLGDHMTVTDRGLIYHPIVDLWKRQLNSSKLSRIKKWLLGEGKIDKERLERMNDKSIGYQSFNLFALARLKKRFGSHPFWNLAKFEQAVRYCFSDVFKNDISGNIYGFPYNPIGFEMPLIISQFGKLSQINKGEAVKYWINRQKALHYNHRSGWMDKDTDDGEVLTARTYELIAFR